MPHINLSVNLCNIRLNNPTILASGILGTTKALLKRVAENGAGAVTIKSISTEPREGHKNPAVITFDAGMLNAVGYSNPGVVVAAREFANLQDVGVPVIASVIGTQKEDFVRVVEGLSGSKCRSNLKKNVFTLGDSSQISQILTIRGCSTMRSAPDFINVVKTVFFHP